MCDGCIFTFCNHIFFRNNIGVYFIYTYQTLAKAGGGTGNKKKYVVGGVLLFDF